MKKLLEIFALVKGYKGALVSNLVFNILNAIFSLFTFAAIVPFLNILFKTGEAPKEPAPEASFVMHLWYKFNVQLDAYIATHGQLIYVKKCTTKCSTCLCLIIPTNAKEM